MSSKVAGEPLSPRLFLLTSGKARLEWKRLAARLPGELAAHGHPVSKPLHARVIVDGEKALPVPDGITQLDLTLSRGQQHDLAVEFEDDARHILHRSSNCLLEVPTVQTVAPATFAAVPPFSIELPPPVAAAWGIENDLAATAAALGHEKVVWLMLPAARSALRKLSPEALDVTARLTPEGLPIGATLVDKRNGHEYQAEPDEVGVKVDAAFNGNAFFWDDMFVSLETAWHLPGLAAATLDFWYDVQTHTDGGVIPREVRKTNLISYNPPTTVVFGDTEPNGGYTNPNLTGWAEWELYALSDPENAKARLPRAISSMESYLGWQVSHRAVRDATGAIVADALWQDNLGSGMDNSPRAGFPEADLASKTAWVDLAAQAIGMRKAEGRMWAALGDWAKADASAAAAAHLEIDLNAHYWSDAEGFYFDRIPGPAGALQLDVATPTIAGFWPLWSGSATDTQVSALFTHQLGEGRFGGAFPFPSLSPTHPLYSDEGHYWQGGRWPNTAAMTIQGLETSGRPDLAFGLARSFLRGMSEVSRTWEKTHGRGTVFEFYGLKREPGQPPHAEVGVQPGHVTRPDFAGWGAVPPVFTELRQMVGLRPVAGFAGGPAEREKWLTRLETSPLFAHESFFRLNPFAHEAAQRSLAAQGYLEWNLLFDWSPRTAPLVVRNFLFHGNRVSSLALAHGPDGRLTVTTESEKPFLLQINRLYGSEGATPKPVAVSRWQPVGGALRVAHFTLTALPPAPPL